MHDQQEFDDLQRQVRQRQIRTREAKTVAKILPDLMARRGFTQSLWSQQLRQAWQAVAPHPLDQQAIPGRLSRGLLEITVASSVVMQTAVFQREALLEALQRQLPQAGIRDLKFRVGQLR